METSDTTIPMMYLQKKKEVTEKPCSHIKAALAHTAVIVILLFGGSAVQADEPLVALPRIVPRETGVLLLPALDATAEAANMQAPRQAVIRHRQQVEFIARQFKVLGETLAAKAAETAPAIDLAHLSARTPENLDLLAKRAGADWVVHTVIQDANANSDEGGEFKVHTRLLLQVWNARQQRWLTNDLLTGQASGNGSPVMVFMRSLDDAAKGSLTNLLNTYPLAVPIEAESSLIDYLAGQTDPFIGDPKKPFTGLKAPN